MIRDVMVWAWTARPRLKIRLRGRCRHGPVAREPVVLSDCISTFLALARTDRRLMSPPISSSGRAKEGVTRNGGGAGQSGYKMLDRAGRDPAGRYYSLTNVRQYCRPR